MGKRTAKSIIREGDQWLYLFTGKRIRDLGKRAIQLYGEDIIKKVGELLNDWDGATVPPNSPYTVLGLLPDASDAVVKAAFRALARDLHPDTGEKPDPQELQRVKEAYDTIVLARKILKEKEKEKAGDHA